MRWVRGDVCVWWGRRKKKGPGYMGGGEKKGNKKEKRNGEWGLRVCEKKGGSGKRKKKLKGKNEISFICMFTLFGAKYRIVKIYLENVYDIFYHKWFVYISITHNTHFSIFFFYYIVQIL